MQPATSSGVSNIETLPNEVLHILLGMLALPDLKAVRLTSRTFSKVLIEHIFKNIRIIIHSESRHRFANIANKPDFRERVRTLTFDLRTMPPYAPLSYDHWFEQCKQFALQPCPIIYPSLGCNYDIYLTFSKHERTAAQSGFEGFCSVLDKFPMIQHLELNGGIDHGDLAPTRQDFIDFKTILPQIGTVPRWKGNLYSALHVAQILTAALTRNKSLTSLSIIGVDWDFIKAPEGPEMTQWCWAMSNIRDFKLRLCVPEQKPSMYASQVKRIAAHLSIAYAKLLQCPTRLESLDFGFLAEPNKFIRAVPWIWCGQEKSFFDVMVSQPALMRYIKKLSFADVVFSPKDFIRLLSNNEEQRLKSLAFHSIHLCEGSWLVFLRHIAEAVDLEHFSLSGWISSVHEGWNALSQEEAAAYYAKQEERLYPYQRAVLDFNPDYLVDCDGFGDWSDEVPALEEKWCVRARIEDWVTSGGGTRRDLQTNQADNPSHWAGWPAEHDDGFPLMRGYFPPCAVHHAPSLERQKQYRYESRWRTRLNRDFSFVWAEDLLQYVDHGHVRVWRPCPKAGRTEVCPALLLEDNFVVDKAMVYEDKENEFKVHNGNVIAKSQSG
jgi:hypothetical protein